VTAIALSFLGPPGLPPPFAALLERPHFLLHAWPVRLRPVLNAPPSGGPAVAPAVAEVAPSRAEPDGALEAERREVALAQAGDRVALGAILRRYGPQLYRSVLLPRLGSQATAEEALSTTYARVVERMHQFRWQGSGFYPWLRTVAVHVAVDMLRARKREVLLDSDELTRAADRIERVAGDEADAATLARHDADDAKRRVVEALGRIHPRYATAIRRRVLEERGRDEVAQELGVSVATFDVVLHRAMAAMRKVMTTQTGEEP
jgi:RNA polymerase sigma factor (sigma-70 family)